MTRDFFSAAQQRALNSYDVPPMRSDFAERVVQRAMSSPTTSATEIAPLRPSRNRSPWARAGQRIGAFATLTILSGAAAAMGLFGDPERIPVVGPIVGEVMAQVFPEEPAPLVAKRSPPIEQELTDATGAPDDNPITAAPLIRDGGQDRVMSRERPTRVEQPTPQPALSRAQPDRPSPARAAQLRSNRPDLPLRRPAAATPDPAQIRDRSADAGVRDPAALRERAAERIEKRLDRQAENQSGQVETRPQAVAAAAPVKPQIDGAEQTDQARLRARATERARQQVREQRQAARPTRARPRDVARERRALRKRRR